MKRAIQTIDPVGQAHAAAEAAAAQSGAHIRGLENREDLAAASSAFNRIWRVSDLSSMIAPELLRALAKSGNYVAGAFLAGHLVGAIVGIFGKDGGEYSLHSHILGILPEAQGRNIGYALKQNQRAWALAQGLDSVTWTYDPLVRRNAHFNITKLGAQASAYYPHFYGEMTDGINSGDESDRLLIKWALSSERAIESSEGRFDEVDAEALVAAGAHQVLEEGPDGSPVLADRTGPVLLCALPSDIVSLRGSDPARAKAWRLAVREVLEGAMLDSYAVTRFTRSGSYVLTKRVQ